MRWTLIAPRLIAADKGLQDARKAHGLRFGDLDGSGLGLERQLATGGAGEFVVMVAANVGAVLVEAFDEVHGGHAAEAEELPGLGELQPRVLGEAQDE